MPWELEKQIRFHVAAVQYQLEQVRDLTIDLRFILLWYGDLFFCAVCPAVCSGLLHKCFAGSKTLGLTLSDRQPRSQQPFPSESRLERPVN